MDIQARLGIRIGIGIGIVSANSRTLNSSSSSSSSSSSKFLCSRRDSQENQPSDNSSNGDKNSTDWDKAWKSYRKRGKKTSFFSKFPPNKYVSWNPRRSEFPLSEEVDPIRRQERSNLMFWTSPGFTLAGAIVLVTFLLIYTILAPVK